MKKLIYWGSFEFKYNKDHEAYPKMKGGFVFVFLKARDVREYLKIVERAICNENLTIKAVEFVKEYDVEWEKPEDIAHFKKLIRQVKKTDQPVFDDFYAYTSYY